jgi:hypothetical protein
MNQAARDTFAAKWGDLLTPELFQRIVLFFECAGFVKQRADRDPFDASSGLKAFDLLDDALQAVLQQSAKDGSAMGQAIWSAFSNPRAQQIGPLLERKR